MSCLEFFCTWISQSFSASFRFAITTLVLVVLQERVLILLHNRKNV